MTAVGFTWCVGGLAVDRNSWRLHRRLPARPRCRSRCSSTCCSRSRRGRLEGRSSAGWSALGYFVTTVALVGDPPLRRHDQRTTAAAAARPTASTTSRSADALTRVAERLGDRRVAGRACRGPLAALAGARRGRSGGARPVYVDRRADRWSCSPLSLIAGPQRPAATTSRTAVDIAGLVGLPRSRSRSWAACCAAGSRAPGAVERAGRAPVGARRAPRRPARRARRRARRPVARRSPTGCPTRGATWTPTARRCELPEPTRARGGHDHRARRRAASPRSCTTPRSHDERELVARGGRRRRARARERAARRRAARQGRGAARLARRGSSRRARASAAGSSATCTTAPSSGWSRWRCTLRLARAQAWTATRPARASCSTARRGARRWRSTSCASWRAASTRRC